MAGLMFACRGNDKKWLGRCRGTPTPFDFLMTTPYLTQRRLVCHSAPPLSLCRMLPHCWHSSRAPSALPAASCTSLGRMANWKPDQPHCRLIYTIYIRRIFLEVMLRRTVRRSLWVWRSRWSRQMFLQCTGALWQQARLNFRHRPPSRGGKSSPMCAALTGPWSSSAHRWAPEDTV
jgi:hypothetical protein